MICSVLLLTKLARFQFFASADVGFDVLEMSDYHDSCSPKRAEEPLPFMKRNENIYKFK